jgi:hypothetical protein
VHWAQRDSEEVVGVVPPPLQQRQQQDQYFQPKHHQQHQPKHPQQQRGYRYSDDSEDDYDDATEVMSRVSGADEMSDVLNRFVETTSEESGGSLKGAQEQRGARRSIPLSRSFEAALAETRPARTSDDLVAVHEPRSRDTTYTWDEDHDGQTGGHHRESRWSGSVYSRISILNEDQSGQTRDRFIQRVEAMMKSKDQQAAPPMPNLAEGLANAKSWNKF